MAKAKGTYVKHRGMIDERVYVNSQKYGYHSRMPPKPGSKKNEPAFKKQYKRTKSFNNLASELNKVLGGYCGSFKNPDFYRAIQKRFRLEPADNRFFLLLQLKKLELNHYHPLNRLGGRTLIIKGERNKIAVNVISGKHPDPGMHKADCYYYELVMMTWARNKKTAAHSRQYSDWIQINDEKPEFDFYFPKPAATTHWLLCLRVRLGKNGVVIDTFPEQAMQIAEVGTLDKKEMAILAKREKDRNANRPVKKAVEEPVRVKAKRIK